MSFSPPRTTDAPTLPIGRALELGRWLWRRFVAALDSPLRPW